MLLGTFVAHIFAVMLFYLLLLMLQIPMSPDGDSCGYVIIIAIVDVINVVVGGYHRG